LFHFRVFATCCCLAAIGGVAAAASSAHAAELSKSEKEAESVAKMAARRFKEGQHEIAARLYQKAFNMNKRPNLLFNAGRAFEMAGNRDEAIRVFKLYLDIEPDVAGREDATARLNVLLEAQRAEQKAATNPPAGTTPDGGQPATAGPTVAAEVKAPDEPSRWPSRIVLGVGAAAAVGGVALMVKAWLNASSLADDLATKDANGRISGVTQVDARDRETAARHLWTTGAVVGGVGLVTAGVGAWMSSRLPATSQASWHVVPAGEGLAVCGAF